MLRIRPDSRDKGPDGAGAPGRNAASLPDAEGGGRSPLPGANRIRVPPRDGLLRSGANSRTEIEEPRGRRVGRRFGTNPKSGRQSSRSRGRGYPQAMSPSAASRVAVVVMLVGASGSAVAAPTPKPSPPIHSATVSLSSVRAGARPVALRLVLTYEMQCGYPGPGPVTIDLPTQERVRSVVKLAQVLVDGHPARALAVSGHTVTVGLAPPPRINCMVIGVGRLTILLTRAAGLGNPLRAGSYTITAARASSEFSARFTIRPA